MPHHVSLSLSPVLPAWLIAATAAALCLLLVQGSLALLRKKVPAHWVSVLGALRAAIVVVFVLCLVQPAVSYTRSTERLPDLLVMIDTSQSMGIKASADGKTRLDAALATLRRGGLLSNLQKQFDVHWFAFDRNAYPIEEADLGGLGAAGDSTRFADSLATAFAYQRQAHTGSLGTSPTRALLLSDGDDLGSDDVVAVAQKLGVTVDTLAPEVSDRADQVVDRVVIASVQSPRSVMLGSEAQVVATLRADGAVQGKLQLSLTEGGKTLASGPVTIRPGESEQTLRLSYRPAEVGLRQYELRLSESVAAEPYQFSVRVLDAKNQVLILEDNWRWEFKFLRRVIEDDPSFSFTALLARGGGSMHAQFAEADRKVSLVGFPQGRNDLAWFDVIVLGDVNPRRWPPGLSAALAQMVKEEGKSLVVIAGPNLTRLAETPELNALLPVEVTGESASPITGPIDVRPSREGAASPFFFNISGGGLPALDRVYPPLRKRPAATILLEAGTRANAYGNLIVMAEHTVGRGRVLFVGTDALWNWQMTGPLDSQGVTPYAAFWQQSLRRYRPAHSHSSDVTLAIEPDRSRYEAGHRVVLRAQYKSDRPLPAPTIESSVTMPDQRQVPLSFAPDPNRPNSYVAEFEPTLAGQYRIAADVSSQGKVAADALAAIDVEPPRGEMNSTRIDEVNLSRIAAGTGGKVVRAADPSTWPTSGDLARYPVEQARRVDLWGNLSLLVLLCGLLGADWLLRLLRGYV